MIRAGHRNIEKKRPKGVGTMKKALLILALGLPLVLFACNGSTETTPTQVPSNPLSTPVEVGSVPTISVSQKCQIAFVSGSNTSEIYIMDADGSNISQLTSNGGLKLYPAWSPDGTRIAFSFTTDPHGPDSEIDIVDVNGGTISLLASHSGYPAWSPDGTRIAFAAYNPTPGEETQGIHIMDADGSNVRQLTSGVDIFPAWSSDGTRIAFVSSSDPNKPATQVYVMDADGGNVHQLTSNGGQKLSPTWSPDGTRIAFQLDSGSYSQIAVINADGSNVHSLTPDNETDRSPSWSPDGTLLAFAFSSGDVDLGIKVMDPNGGNVRILNSNGGYPAWSPLCK
jgi:TolB protein